MSKPVRITFFIDPEVDKEVYKAIMKTPKGRRSTFLRETLAAHIKISKDGK